MCIYIFLVNQIINFNSYIAVDITVLNSPTMKSFSVVFCLVLVPCLVLPQEIQTDQATVELRKIFVDILRNLRWK